MRSLRKMLINAMLCIALLLAAFSAPVVTDAYQTVQARIPINCLKVRGEGTHVYKIRIETDNNYAPVPASDLIEISEEGEGYFEIEITEPGTFRYRIFEEKGEDPDIEYDSNIYILTVFVENSGDDELIYSVSAAIDGKAGKTERIQFHNGVMGDQSGRDPIVPETDVDDPISITGDTTPLSAVSCIAVISFVIGMFAFLFGLFGREEGSDE